MGRKSYITKKDKRINGKSKYETKQKGRAPGIRRITRRYYFHSETIKTSLNILIRVNYFENPTGLQVVSHAERREIYSLFINRNDKNIYSLKQQGYSQEGRGMASSTLTFQELYSAASWLTPKGEIELNAIKETIRKKKEPIEKHLGIKLDIG